MADCYAATVRPLLGAATCPGFTSFQGAIAKTLAPRELDQVAVAKQALTADGGGLHSNGDWSFPPPHCKDHLRELRLAWEKDIKDLGLLPKLKALLDSEADHPPWNATEVLHLQHTLVKCLQAKGVPADPAVAMGQPYCLQLLHSLQTLVGDGDTTLTDMLSEGVHLGVDEPIQASGVWIPQTFTTDPLPDDLTLCDSNWKSADDNAPAVATLVDAYLKKERMQLIKGDVAEATKRWGNRVATGKLGLVQVPGKKDRLIGDSTICGVTGRIKIMERIYHPGPDDVDSAVQSPTAPRELCGLSIDVEAAHNTIKVIESDHGLLLFRAPDGRLVGFTVCHFGGKSSAYWWSCLAALLIRLGHKVLYVAHAGFIYVDDFLWLLRLCTAPLQACTLLALLTALKVPISWRKLKLGTSLDWIGWTINLRYRIWDVQESKVAKAFTFLEATANASTMEQKQMEKGTGFMLWLTGRFPLHRRFLPSFWHCLKFGGCRSVALSRDHLAALIACLADNLVVTGPCLHAPYQPGWQVLAIAGKDINTLNHAHQVRAIGSRRMWCRFRVDDSTEVKVSKNLQACALLWLNSLKYAPRQVPMDRRVPQACCTSSADAYAEGHLAGIGGWFMPDDMAPDAAKAYWFALPISHDALAPFVAVNKDLQRVISCLETLAQTALLVARSRCTPFAWGHHKLVLQSDNAPTVGAVNKLTTCAWLQAFFIDNIASWAEHLQCFLDVHHLPGHQNGWADGLSRQFDDTMQLFAPDKTCHLSVSDLLTLPKMAVSDKFGSKAETLSILRGL